MFSTRLMIGRSFKLRPSSISRLVKRCLFVFILMVLGTSVFLRGNIPPLIVDNNLPEEIFRFDDVFELERFDNETGADQFLVPNIVHFIRFNTSEFTFVDYICVQAVFRNHKPELIYFHTDVPNGHFRGKYWNLIQNDYDLFSSIRVKYLELPSEVFGQKLSDQWRLWHGSDVARIQIMMEYGGIYLDNDMYVIGNLDKYRKFEATVSWRNVVGNQVIIANRNARLLPLWLDTYRDYRADLWYYNGGELPTKAVLIPHPELVHREKVLLGIDNDLSSRLYDDIDFPWRKLDSVHLMTNHRFYMDPIGYKNITVFDEKNVENYPYPFGEMAREMVKSSGMYTLLENSISL